MNIITRFLLSITMGTLFIVRAFSGVGVTDGMDDSGSTKYIVRLVNGDILTGVVVERVTSETKGDGIKLKTDIGIPTLYESEIAEVTIAEEHYRHAHRVFLLPTAEPIKNNHFIGNLELLGLWGGFGIMDILSVTAARTFVPGIPSQDQASYINAKATLYRADNTSEPGHISIAAGANLAWLNASNRLTHLFAAATFTRIRSRVTATVFYNMSGSDMDIFTARAGTYGSAVIRYPNGAIGIGIGVDSRFPGRHDIHFIGELWNNDLSKPTNSAVILGLRVANSALSVDFGMAVISAPAVVPIMSFAWTPL